jgi:hypothetical protein
LALEIENAVTRKHLLGGVVNACALGRLGILVAWTDPMLRAAFGTRKYLAFLGGVGKPSVNISNLLVLSREQTLTVFGIQGNA